MRDKITLRMFLKYDSIPEHLGKCTAAKGVRAKASAFQIGSL